MALQFPEDRDDTRFGHISPIQVKDLRSGRMYEARMLNHSGGGIYFESDGIFQKGTKIYICMQNSPYSQSSGVLEYSAGKVMWRKDLEDSPYYFGYGVQLLSGLNEQEYESNGQIVNESRKHSRVPYNKNVLFSTQKGTHAGRTKNISSQGLFIATEENLEVGQSLKLNLPLKNDKTAEILGQIVWLNEEGLGLKFKKIT